MSNRLRSRVLEQLARAELYLPTDRGGFLRGVFSGYAELFGGTVARAANAPIEISGESLFGLLGAEQVFKVSPHPFSVDGLPDHYPRTI